ncbi:hypothetical protein FCL40_06505 [Ferrimonas sediminicola]|uniref:Uncharacterized protein n=1 Tax=Ferrimonas sediminicola TaxID=2569538 RepID=A0A4U1BID1_9GAMM|nr:hypothetical protein [Ferrimonas sediminicola]TKB49806.1 hypothetical protein FCL40_06505 [Ferrimonas sediminicola]
MHRLSSYIRAIQCGSGVVSLTGQVETLADHRDELAQVQVRECRYRFSNGVQLLYRCEEELTDCAESMCPECWLSYRVVDPRGLTIRPMEKSFSNRCQQQFWLKMQAANDGSAACTRASE